MENSKNCQKRLLENSEKFSYASFENVLFDWSRRNQELINSVRNSMMKFFIVSIDREFLPINWMLFSIENQSNKAEALWWISSFVIDQVIGLADRRCWILNFHLPFWLSVKTLIKGKVMCDEITHGSIYSD